MPLAPGQRERRQAAALANQLISESLPPEDIIGKIRTDPAIDAPIRQAALAMVERHRPNPERFFSLASSVIARPGCGEDEYRLALRRAQAASRLVPEHNTYFAMVGMGYYRIGDCPKAVAILEKADGAYVSQGIPGGGAPWNLAFLAMTYRKLGRVDKARATLTRLRRTMAHPSWSGMELYRAMLEEAEALIEPGPKELPGDVFAPAAESTVPGPHVR
jgi:hypothetical protein